jgi:hypothetical protein
MGNRIAPKRMDMEPLQESGQWRSGKLKVKIERWEVEGIVRWRSV